MMLEYLTEVVRVGMDADDLVPSADNAKAVAKIVDWIREPKSNDIRRASSTVIMALFSLNASNFTQILETLPKPSQVPPPPPSSPPFLSLLRALSLLSATRRGVGLNGLGPAVWPIKY